MIRVEEILVAIKSAYFSPKAYTPFYFSVTLLLILKKRLLLIPTDDTVGYHGGWGQQY